MEGQAMSTMDAPERVATLREWWITTERLDRGGRKIDGPFPSMNDAIKARVILEGRTGQTYWVDDEKHEFVAPSRLLAVIADARGRRYFRWSYDVHTFAPWRALGAVHADTEEDYRWCDLTGDREPVELLSEGVPEPS